MEYTFEQYGLSRELMDALTAMGYKEPTKIQQGVIPLVLAHKDVIGKSHTGSGKTAAFAIPLCEMVKWEEHTPQVLVIEPTRELAVQVREEIFSIGRHKRLKVPVVFGGVDVEKQVTTLKQKSHIVVGTPGRILDHIRRESLKLDQVKALVMDEADLMLDMGFLPDMEQIISELPKERVNLLFSATWDEKMKSLTESFMTNPQEILVEEETETAENITQEAYLVSSEDKIETLLDILIRENPKECMIFCGTREMVNVLYRYLGKEHIKAGMLHGEIDQRERLSTIEDFRRGRINYLLATDVAARGIDFDNITHVINFDFPTNKEVYVHRIGRTGRNGKSGKAISILTPEEEYLKKREEEFTKAEIIMRERPEQSELEEKRQSFVKSNKAKPVERTRKTDAVNKDITKLAIGGGKKSKLRAGDIVGALCSVESMTAEDIGVIDIRDSISYVDILHGKGQKVFKALQDRPIKGKVRKISFRKNSSKMYY